MWVGSDLIIKYLLKWLLRTNKRSDIFCGFFPLFSIILHDFSFQPLSHPLQLPCSLQMLMSLPYTWALTSGASAHVPLRFFRPPLWTQEKGSFTESPSGFFIITIFTRNSHVLFRDINAANVHQCDVSGIKSIITLWPTWTKAKMFKSKSEIKRL